MNIAILPFTLFYVWLWHIPKMDWFLCDVVSEHSKMLEGLDEEPSTALLFAAQARVFFRFAHVSGDSTCAQVANLLLVLSCEKAWRLHDNLSIHNGFTWWNNVE